MSVYSTIMRDVYEMVALSCDAVVLIDILPIRDILQAATDIIEDFDEDNPGAEYPPLAEHRLEIFRSWD